MRFHAVTALAALGLVGLAAIPDASAASKAEDCAFLEETFERLTGAANARAVNPTLADITVIQAYTNLQSNVIQLHTARGCDAEKLVDIVRKEPLAQPAGGVRIEAADEGPDAAHAAPAPDQIQLEPLEELRAVKNNANVRAGPSSQTAVIGTLSAGSRVPVVGQVRGLNWFKIQLDNTEGYVWGDLLMTEQAFQADIARRAQEGDHEAQYLLGNQMIRTDEFEAISWWQAAAEGGHAGAQYNMGVAHYKGTAVAKDVDQAKDWWRKAAAQGHQKASDFLAQLGN